MLTSKAGVQGSAQQSQMLPREEILHGSVVVYGGTPHCMYLAVALYRIKTPKILPMLFDGVTVED